MLIKIETGATLCRYLFTTKPLSMFRVSQHPSSGVLKTVTAASGTGHNIGTATSLQRGREVALPISWPVPEAAVTVFSTPDDGCCDTRNMESGFVVNKYLYTVASVALNYDARNHELKKSLQCLFQQLHSSKKTIFYKCMAHNIHVSAYNCQRKE